GRQGDRADVDGGAAAVVDSPAVRQRAHVVRNRAEGAPRGHPVRRVGVGAVEPRRRSGARDGRDARRLRARRGVQRLRACRANRGVGDLMLSKDRIVAPPGFNRWLVPPAALAIHLSIGMAYGFSVFWLPLSRAIGVTAPAPGDWKISTLGWMFTLFFVF